MKNISFTYVLLAAVLCAASVQTSESEVLSSTDISEIIQSAEAESALGAHNAVVLTSNEDSSSDLEDAQDEDDVPEEEEEVADFEEDEEDSSDVDSSSDSEDAEDDVEASEAEEEDDIDEEPSTELLAIGGRAVTMQGRDFSHEAAKKQLTKAALDVHGGDYKAALASMIQHVKNGLEIMQNSTTSQLRAVTDKRDAAKLVLDRAVRTVAEREKTFSDSLSAKEAVERACKTAQDLVTGTRAVFSAATSSFTSRNPVIEKELALIRSIVDKVAELNATNLQETRNLITDLQTYEAEAGPLFEMIDIAREHAEFTRPILVLLSQIQAKIVAERDSINAAVSSARSAYDAAQSKSSDSCDKVEVKRIESASAQTQFNSATAARDAAQQEYDNFQRLWASTHASADKSTQSYKSELRFIDQFQMCSLAAPKPYSSCLELLKDRPDAKSGVYTMTPYGQSEDIKVYCDMTTKGGGWTLIAQTVARTSACDRTASSCPNGERNLYNLRDGGGNYKSAQRGKSTWSIPNAAKIAQNSKEIAIARWDSWESGTGDISMSNAASSFRIPNPATVNFANPSHLNPDQTSRGTCVTVKVTSIVGGASCIQGCDRVTFSNSLGTTWTDTYPTSIGAATGTSCVNDNNGGPALASDDTGTFNPGYINSWGKTTAPTGSPYYWHEGLWDVDAKNKGGLGTVWLR